MNVTILLGAIRAIQGCEWATLPCGKSRDVTASRQPIPDILTEPHMRLIQLLLAIAISGCASDLVDSTGVGPQASALILTPDSTTVDLAGTLQFEAKARWSDGHEHPASVSYSASSGEISSTGLYRAPETPGLVTVIATCGCGVADTALVTIKGPFTATQLVLTPESSAVDTGATQQFVPAVTWSDNADHPALLSYTATGGTISPVGLYTAGNVAGQFQVIATCACGVADTSLMQVGTTGPVAGLSALTINVAGLPAGAPAQIDLTGPAGFTRRFSATTRFDSLPPGEYAVRASGLSVSGSNFGPVTAAQTVTLAGGGVGALVVSFRQLLSDGLPAHPRVWMTPDRIVRLQTQVANGTQRWLRVKSAADGQLAKGSATGGNDVYLLPELCLAYLGTRDARYAARAGVVLTGYAVESNDLKYDSGYGVRFMVPLVTMGLDWCYDGLSVAQRQQAATWLMNRADWTWPQSTPARAGAWGTSNVKNNYFWGFMMTGPAALAAAGDDTGTGAISGTDRPAWHRALALTKWNTLAVPFFNGEGEGGAWSEGTNYDSSWRVGSFADAFLTSGAPLANSFLAATLQWRMHASLPGGVYKVPFGAQPRDSRASLYSYDRMYALYALPNASGEVAGQIHSWLDLIGQTPTQEFNEGAVLADELLRYDPAQSSVPLATLPKSYHAIGAGFFVYRQSWTDPNATVMAFESGPTADAGARDANGLMIWKGSFWISATANLYSQSGIETDSRMYNNLTVGGQGQTLSTGNGGAFTAPPVVTDALVVVRGQAKNGYGYQNEWANTRTVSDYLRTVAYLPSQDIFVIVDRATILNAALPKTWRWHMRDVPQVNGNTFRLQSQAGDFRCFGTVLSPGDVTLGSETYNLAQGGGVSSSAVTVTTSGRATDVVVTVLQCTGAQSAPATPTATVDANEAAVSVAGRRVTVPLNELQPVRID
ncbi:MAG: hypothetical protein V4558_02865 [Gemmatimonadota bacterium]